MKDTHGYSHTQSNLEERQEVQQRRGSYIVGALPRGSSGSTIAIQKAHQGLTITDADIRRLALGRTRWGHRTWTCPLFAKLQLDGGAVLSEERTSAG